MVLNFTVASLNICNKWLVTTACGSKQEIAAVNTYRILKILHGFIPCHDVHALPCSMHVETATKNEKNVHQHFEN